MQKCLLVLVAATLALVLLPLGCRADTPSYDNATAEEILAAAEEAMAEVGSFVSVLETTYGFANQQEWDTIEIESEFRDTQNYRKRMSVRTPGAPLSGPSEFALVGGEVYLSGPEDAIRGNALTALPVYGPLPELANLERLDDETLEDIRAYRLRGTLTHEPADTFITVDLFIDSKTLLLFRLDGETNAYVESPDLHIQSHSTITYSRFNEDIVIVPPAPASTPTPDPTPTSQP